MVRFIILGPHGCGKHALAKALGYWSSAEIFRVEEECPEDQCGVYLAHHWAPEPTVQSAHAVFAHVEGTAEFEVSLIVRGGELPVGRVRLSGDRIVVASPAPPADATPPSAAASIASPPAAASIASPPAAASVAPPFAEELDCDISDYCVLS